MRILTPLLCTLVLGVQSASAARLALVENGKPTSEIILSKDATVVEHYAATELQRAIRLATGAEVSILTGPDSAQLPRRIVIATAPHLKALENAPAPSAVEHKDDDQITICHTDETLYLIGSNARSALYATYRFLEKSLGFRWFWPGETGEYFEQKEGIVLNDFELKEKGALRYRYLAINAPHYDHDTLVWMARNRMNIHFAGPYLNDERYRDLHEKGFIIRLSGHGLTLPLSEMKEHPDYIAEYAGRRQISKALGSAHLCWSNPGVQQALIGQIAGTLKKHPLITSLGIYPVDQTQFCQCAQCVAMAEDVSTRYQKLWKILIDGLRPQFPDLQFTNLAYQAYRPVAKEAAPFDMFQYTAYNVSYRHPLDSGHPANATALKEMKEWKAMGVPTGLRGYELIPTTEPMFIPNVRYIVGEMNFLKQNGMTSFSTEVPPYGARRNADTPLHYTRWFAHRMNLYAIGRATWEQEVTSEAIVADWMTALYGAKASEPMKRYYFAMEKSWQAAPGDISYFLNPAAPYARGFITLELIATAEAAFKEARTLLMEEPDAARRERALGQVDAEEQMFGEWQKLYLLLAENAERYQVSALPANATDAELMNPDAPVWKNAPVLPEFLNGKTLPEDTTEVRALWTKETLYLHAVCHEVSDIERVARFKEHDEAVWNEDALELFVNRKEGGYYHLALNPLGTRYDALSQAGMNLDTSANPEWKAQTRDRDKGWSAVIALPLAEFAMVNGRDGEAHLSLKRTRPGPVTSGWPDAAYHSPASYGAIRLAHAPAGQILLYNATPANTQATESELRNRGWTVSELQTGAEALPEDAKVILLRYWTGVGFTLAADEIRQTLMPWVEAGGTLIISACNQIPWQQWFEDNELAVKWSGWEIDPDRISVDIAEGKWQSEPNDLQKALKTGIVPSSGFQPLSEGWEALATLRMRNDSEPVPYLLRARFGKGKLILTSSDMGYGGGHELFGSLNPRQVTSLIENLSHTD